MILIKIFSKQKHVTFYNKIPCFCNKVKLSKKFLEAIFLLQINILDVNIYLLDLSLENIAYNKFEDKVIFIDVEHAIIVDQKKLKLGI
jgi:hypothetical protein